MKKNRTVMLSVLFYFTCVFCFSVYQFLNNTEAILKKIDENLYTVALTLPYVIGEEQMAELMKGTLSENEYDVLVLKLSEFKKIYKVNYLYIMKVVDDKIINVVTSANNEELENKSYQRFNDLFLENFAPIYKAVSSNRVVYNSLEDSWGKFRSVYVPIQIIQGESYFIGVDIATSEINEILLKDTFKTIIIGLLFLVFALPLVFFPYHNISHTMVEQKHDFEELQIITEQYKALSYKDSLTDLPNRRSFFDTAIREIDKSKHLASATCIVMTDIDFFKKINDTYGHVIGDIVLQQFAKNTRSNFRGGDILGRYGGEEFIALLPNTDLRHGKEVAERARTICMNTPIVINDETSLTITISLGVALINYKESHENSTELLLDHAIQHADLALYKAKQTGRNKVCVYDDEGE